MLWDVRLPSIFAPVTRRPPRRLMAAFPTLRAVLRAPQARLVDALGPADGRALFAFLRRTAWADAKEGGGGAGAGGGGQAPPHRGRPPVTSPVWIDLEENMLPYCLGIQY